MKNPLRKGLPQRTEGRLGKYLVFILMVGPLDLYQVFWLQMAVCLLLTMKVLRNITLKTGTFTAEKSEPQQRRNRGAQM